jgi:predicted RNase H-like HicB family nuclease
VRGRYDINDVSFEDYKVVLYRNQPDGWVAEIPAVPGCYALMPTREAALAELADVFEMVRAEYREAGRPLPADTTELVHAWRPGGRKSAGLQANWAFSRFARPVVTRDGSTPTGGRSQYPGMAAATSARPCFTAFSANGYRTETVRGSAVADGRPGMNVGRCPILKSCRKFGAGIW